MMVPGFRLAATAWLVLVAFASISAQPLSEAQKQLLSSSISEDAAMQMGKEGDVAAFARIVATGDGGLVSRYGTGMSLGGIKVLPPEVEALVVRNFDHAALSPTLRAMPPKYQTRALFDRYYARVLSTSRGFDQVFKQILNTDQPGIDAEILEIMPRFFSLPHETNPALAYLAQRKYPGAVPALIAAIEPAYRADSQYNNPLTLLLRYDTPEVWRRADAEVRRLRAAGRVPDNAYQHSRFEIDPLVTDPDGAIKRRRASEAAAPFNQERLALAKSAPPATLRAEPVRYIEAQARYLDSVDALLAKYPHESGAHTVGTQYGSLALYVRVVGRDVPRALKLYERGAQGRSGIALVGLADTYQLALRDPAKAIAAYQRALDIANAPPGPINPFGSGGTPINAFWTSWFSAEIEFLRTGKPFRGRVPEAAISGFWTILSGWRGSLAIAYPAWPVSMRVVSSATRSVPAYSGYALGQRGDSTQGKWSDIESVNAAATDDGLVAKLPALPASRYSFMVALRHISVLKDPARILAELERHDPSGYWTTIVLGTVDYHERTGRDGALADGTADAMPGMGSPAKPNPLSAAARRYLQSRGLRPTEKK
ncbi:MAG: hypothetical protein ABI885_11330 [Gammaproteobacteria bacterium]